MNNYTDNLFDAQAPLDDEKLWDLLSLYVDGEADPAQAAIVERMLSSDPAYRRDFDFLMQTSKTMHLVEEVAPPQGLRDAIYSRTVCRPTLARRLRAAWSRATTPAFGRYASVGGACAAAAIGVLLVWPRLSPTPTHPTVQPPVVAVVTPPSQPNDTLLPMPHGRANLGPINTAHNADLSLKQVSHTEQVRNTPHNKPLFVIVQHSPDAGKMIVAAKTPAPHNHFLVKNSALRADSSVKADLPGYAYDKNMDKQAAADRAKTILPNGNDFGPPVAANDPTPMPHTGDSTASLVKSTEDAVQTTPQPTPQSHIRTVALPPEASHNIAAAVIRHDMTAHYDGYDHNVTANIQRRQIMIDVIKGSF